MQNSVGVFGGVRVRICTVGNPGPCRGGQTGIGTSTSWIEGLKTRIVLGSTPVQMDWRWFNAEFGRRFRQRPSPDLHRRQTEDEPRSGRRASERARAGLRV